MKSRTWKWMIALSLFAALAMPLGMAAQDTSSQDHKPKHHKYKLIDVGTLGGPTSFLFDVGNGGPNMNSQGAVVGAVQTTVPLGPTNNPYLCWAYPNVNHALLWRKGHTIDLGALPPADQNCSGPPAVAINDNGDIAFQSENGIVDPLLGVNELRAVLWHEGRLTDLGTFGGNASGTFGINNRGQVAGFALNTVPDPFSFYALLFLGSTNSTQTRAFLWQNGRMRDLGTLGGPDASATFVNGAGQVTGNSYTNAIPNPTTGLPTVHPYFWKEGRMYDIGSLGGTFGIAQALNSRGQVAGWSNLVGDVFPHAFFWDRGAIRDIGTFGGDTSVAEGMNDAGEAVGVADFAGDELHDGFLWRNGRMTDLGNLGVTSHAFSINNHGQIVGNSRIDDTNIHSFLWENGEMVDLNDLVSPKSDVVLDSFGVIGDNGEIAGSGLPPGCIDESACGHAYVLIPNGDCDGDNEARIAATQNRIAAERAANAQHPATSQRADSPLTPIERFRSRMRQRFGFPSSHPTLRD